ncbi:hypothetical protein KBX35_22250 [Micromonospora sp. C32]|uniref:hypothetical protein n=1 Tax=unclassified Micromonospora TaxID=2617518 RepID=UPI001B373435|nr:MULTISPECIES: hypothetical protein [unclassified Micromonospora]MBQ1043847.1 hypothetical protein [Micromonospora sp. C72]MBQ1057512.1 hypothetical protein [Micromonospora sp. C32]
MKLTPEEQWALNAPWTEFIARAEVEVEYEPRPARNTYMVELSEDDLTWLFEEAQRRSVNPSAVIRDLMSQARDSRDRDTC